MRLFFNEFGFFASSQVNMPIPKIIKIKREAGFHTDQIGITEKSKQFMGFVVAAASDSQDKSTNKENLSWFAVLHIFENNGVHINTEAVCTGNYIDGTEAVEKAEKQLRQMIKGLGRVSYRDINVKLFQVQVKGITFGLIDRSVKEENHERIDLLPNGLSFSAPWNGLYDT